MIPFIAGAPFRFSQRARHAGARRRGRRRAVAIDAHGEVALAREIETRTPDRRDLDARSRSALAKCAGDLSLRAGDDRPHRRHSK
jgi:hypothetical protein